MGDPNSRREFLQAGLAGAAAAGITGSALAREEKQDEAKEGNRKDGDSNGLPRRELGKTGERVSILALGGWHIGAVKDEGEAIRIMHTAIDEGLTFFDNAWDYHDGKAEEVMGKALVGGKRDKVFLMTKNCNRDGAGTRRCLEDSLRRLQTDHLDLWQFHETNYDNDPDWVLEKGGLAEALKAQKEGKVRFIGFTGHKDPRIHLKMLAKHRWDTAQMPINVCDHFYRSFTRQVVPEANRRGTAVIGMKSLGGGQPGRFVKAGVCSAEEAIRFALSQPIAALVTGIDSMEILKQNIGIARSFRPMDGAEQRALLARVRPLAGDGRHERFKSTQFFDSPYHQRQHGLTKQEVES